jgi:ornithine lipid ester-linked acyl 2-hydroxylase
VSQEQAVTSPRTAVFPRNSNELNFARLHTLTLLTDDRIKVQLGATANFFANMKEQGIIYRLISGCVQRFIVAIEYILRRYSRRVIKEPAWGANLCLHTDNMRAEFLRLFDENLREYGSISPEQSRITGGNSWRIFILRAYGRTFQTNCLQAKETSRMCFQTPEISSAAFSIFEPGTNISPHRGIYAGVLRGMTPIIVSDGDCGIRIGGEIYRWQVARPLFFDDTGEHEAWNQTSERRVALLIDYFLPLPQPLAAINRWVIWLIGRSPFIGRKLRASM